MHAVSVAMHHCVEDSGWGCAVTSGSLGGVWLASWSPRGIPKDVGMPFSMSTTCDMPWGRTTGRRHAGGARHELQTGLAPLHQLRAPHMHLPHIVDVEQSPGSQPQQSLKELLSSEL